MVIFFFWSNYGYWKSQKRRTWFYNFLFLIWHFGYIYSQPKKGCPPNPTNCQNVRSTSQIVISIILVQILPLALSLSPPLPPRPNFSSLLAVYGSCLLGAWFDGSEPVLGGSLILDQTPPADGQIRRLKFERTAHNSDLEKIENSKNWQEKNRINSSLRALTYWN